MSQMKRVLDVVQDLRSLADSIAALAGTTVEVHTGTMQEAHAGTAQEAHARSISDKTEAVPATSTATTAQEVPKSAEQFKGTIGADQPDEEPTEGPRPATETERPSEPAAQPKLSVAELRAFVAERSTPENRPKIRAILACYGVAKLTDLADEHYADLKAEVDAL